MKNNHEIFPFKSLTVDSCLDSEIIDCFFYSLALPTLPCKLKGFSSLVSGMWPDTQKDVRFMCTASASKGIKLRIRGRKKELSYYQ